MEERSRDELLETRSKWQAAALGFSPSVRSSVIINNGPATNISMLFMTVRNIDGPA